MSQSFLNIDKCEQSNQKQICLLLEHQGDKIEKILIRAAALICIKSLWSICIDYGFHLPSTFICIFTLFDQKLETSVVDKTGSLRKIFFIDRWTQTEAKKQACKLKYALKSNGAVFKCPALVFFFLKCSGGWKPLPSCWLSGSLWQWLILKMREQGKTCRCKKASIPRWLMILKMWKQQKSFGCKKKLIPRCSQVHQLSKALPEPSFGNLSQGIEACVA